jgi:hypothetical protein
MLTFTKPLLTIDGHYVFIFHRIFTVDGSLYYIGVNNKRNQSFYFYMEQKEGVWTLRDLTKVAEWILPLEHQLADAIEENTTLPDKLHTDM